jgi:hypothetical protein
MENKSSERINVGDEENTAFGLPEKVTDQKSGFDRSGLDSKAAKQEVETGKDLRRRPREEKDIPQEPLAARIGKIQKGDGD